MKNKVNWVSIQIESLPCKSIENTIKNREFLRLSLLLFLLGLLLWVFDFWINRGFLINWWRWLKEWRKKWKSGHCGERSGIWILKF